MRCIVIVPAPGSSWLSRRPGCINDLSLLIQVLPTLLGEGRPNDTGGGYLSFMGNEFGHPEWIDFPREGNDWSYHYARRQWHLVEDDGLRYRFFADFARAMIDLIKQSGCLRLSQPLCRHGNELDQVPAFTRDSLLLSGRVFAMKATVNGIAGEMTCPTG